MKWLKIFIIKNLLTLILLLNCFFFQELLKNLQLKTEPVNGQIKSEKEEKTDDKNSPLTWLLDVALSKEDKKNSCRVSSLFYTVSQKDPGRFFLFWVLKI